VVKDLSGKFLTAELPDPEEIPQSPFRQQIIAVRKTVTSAFHPATKVQEFTVGKKLRLTGLGYFGRVDAKHGLKNGLQLHPLTGVQIIR